MGEITSLPITTRKSPDLPVSSAVSAIDHLVAYEGAENVRVPLAQLDTYVGSLITTSNLVTNTTLADADATLTAAQLVGGEFTIIPTVARTLTTDTAVDIIAAVTNSVNNSNFDITLVNLDAFDVTIAAGVGVTLVNSMVVNGGSGTFKVRRLTPTTVSVTRLETGVANTQSYAKITDTKAGGTAGGTFTQGVWQTRTLNTIDFDADSIIALSTDQITLQAGTYIIKSAAPASSVDGHKSRFRNITDSTTDIVGTSEHVTSSVSVTSRSFIYGLITIASEKVFEVQHYAQTTRTTRGFGQDSSTVSEAAVYTTIEIWKVA